MKLRKHVNDARELHRLRTLHLFAGAGGGILADVLLGHQPVGAVEIDDHCRQVLAQRQKDGLLPWFPIFDDVRTFDGTQYRNIADVVAGGFPCQDISVAGNGAGLDGEQSGLWREMARIVGEVRPRYVYIENSTQLKSARKVKARLTEVVDTLFGRVQECREITVATRPDILRVLEELAAMGYDAQWGCVSAHEAGAPHIRDRIWILATLADADGAKPVREQIGGAARYAESCNDSANVPDTLRDGAGEGLCEPQREAAPKMEGARRRLPAEPRDVHPDVPDSDRAGREEQCGAVATRSQHASAECGGADVADAGHGRGRHLGPVEERRGEAEERPACAGEACGPGGRGVEPGLGRGAHGLAARLVEFGTTWRSGELING